MSRVTIQALARELGLSKSTVSRALNDYPDISLETKRRVSKTALQIGYHPSSQARGLRSGRTHTVGLVLDMDSGNTHRPFLSSFLDGISRTLSERGWTLNVATASGMTGMVDTHRKLLLDQKVDGFILPRNHIEDGRIDLLSHYQVPFVIYGRCPSRPEVPCFDILSEDSMLQAVIRLAEFGHKRIAFVGGHADANYQRLRLDGFKAGMRAAGLEVDIHLCQQVATTEQAGHASGLALWRLAAPPTAIVCAVDRAALGVCQAAKGLGLQLGRDVSVIGYDGIPEGRYAHPKLTSFASDNYCAGASLARLLVDSVEEKEPNNKHELQAALFLPGETDGPSHLSSDELAARLRH